MLTLMLAAAIAQDAPVRTKAPAPPERFSILADACAPAARRAGDIVVCGKNEQRLPLPDERTPPDRPLPSNPNLDGVGALGAANLPCGSMQGGCQTGIDILGMGTAVIRLVQKAASPDSCCEEAGEGTNPMLLVRDVVRGVKRGVAGKPDKSKRVPIPLD